MDESKLAPELVDEMSRPHALDVGVKPIPVIIKYRADAVRSHTVRQGVRARYIYRLTPTVATVASSADVRALTDDDTIEFIWLDQEVHTCLDQSVPTVGVPAVWNSGYRGAGIKIAVIDTGIDRAHPDLAGRIAAGIAYVGSDYQDDSGHGTHVAGIIAGAGAAMGGRYVGVAPQAQLYVAKVLDSAGAGAISGVMAGIEWAVEQQVDVINLSLGGSGSSDGQDALSMTCNAAVERGIVLCAAAGNNGPAERTVGAPGAAEQVITVGAADRFSGVAGFSSRGPTADGRPKPDICLPGVDIVSARASGPQHGEPIGERYTSVSGTSMATPFAAGIAALLLQAQPGMTPAEVKEALLETALDLGVDPNAQGQGLGRGDQALSEIVGHVPPPPTPEPEPVPGGVDSKGCLPTFLVSFVGR